MKYTLKMLIVATAIFICGSAMGQTIKIPGTEASLTLPSNNWQYLRTFTLDDGADIYVYYYNKTTILDGDGDTVLPCLRIYVNKNYTGDMYSLVYQRYSLQPYQSLKEYMHGPGLPKSGGLGYIGAYTNPKESKDYEFMMTYFKSGKAFVELRLETTKDTYKQMEDEFSSILKSLK